MAVVAALMSMSAAAFAAASVQNAVARIARLNWLHECWLSGAGSVLFEHLQHDFPQRIGYRRDALDRLTAWIEGTSGGRTRRVEFPYRRAACAA